MLKIHKNRVFTLIEEKAAKPEVFLAQETNGSRQSVFKLSLRSKAQMFFCFKTYERSFNSFKCCYTNFDPHFSATGWIPATECQFSDIETLFVSWLNEHALKCLQEVEEPDFWAMLDGRVSFVVPKFCPDDKSGFDNTCQMSIQVALSSVLVKIETLFSPTSIQINSIRAQIDYLKEALGRLSKFDWKSILLSTIVGIATSLSCDTVQGKKLVELFTKALSGVSNYLS